MNFVPRRGSASRIRPIAVLCAVALAAAACSSTSKSGDDGRDLSGSGGPEASGGAIAGPGGDATGGPSAPASGGGGGGGGSRSSGVARSGGGDGSSDESRVVDGLTLGRGVTEKQIKIGFNITTNLQAGFAVVGANASSEDVDEQPIVEALVKYFNKHGGIRGKTIKPIFYEYDAASANTWDAFAEAACQRFIEDEKVYAVVSGHVGQTDSLVACLAKGKIPLVQQNQWPYDAKYFKDYREWLYQPSRMRPERWVPAYIGGLKDAGYFNTGYKLGLMRFDAPVFTRISKLMKSEITKRGLKLTDEFVVRTPQGVREFGGMAAQLNNAILQFRTSGVTHVIFDEYGAIMPFFYLQQADSQGYRPRYGFTSVNLPGTIQQQVGPSQLSRSIGVSWLPGQDAFPNINDPRKGGAFGLCMQIRKDSGMAAPSRLYVGTHCDSLLFLRSALAKVTQLTSGGLLKGAELLGTGFDSPYTWKTKFGVGRPDGASAVRIQRYKDGCECFKYDAGALRSAG
jgi:hypothetical protein